MLACYFCYAKLKQCYQLQRKCLEAEELFAQMMNNYELKPLTNPGHSEFVGGFVTTAIENINIVDDGQTDGETIVIELPAISTNQCDIVMIKTECQSDEDDVPLMEFKTEVAEMKQETEVPKPKETSKNTQNPRFCEKNRLNMSSCDGIRHDNGGGADLSDNGNIQNEIEEIKKNRAKILNKIRCQRYRHKKKIDAIVSSQNKDGTITVEEENNLKTSPDRQIQDNNGGTYFSDYRTIQIDIDDIRERRRKVQNKIRCQRYRNKKKTDAIHRTIAVGEEDTVKRRRKEYDKQKSKRYRDKKRVTNLINSVPSVKSDTSQKSQF